MGKGTTGKEGSPASDTVDKTCTVLTGARKPGLVTPPRPSATGEELAGRSKNRKSPSSSGPSCHRPEGSAFEKDACAASWEKKHTGSSCTPNGRGN